MRPPFARIPKVARGMLLLTALTTSAVAQRVEPLHPLAVIVGRVESPAPTERVDGMRRGFASTSLPEGTLRVVWQRSIGPSIEHSPLVTPEGDAIVFTVRGDLVELGTDGVEKRRLGLGLGPLGPGAILADGTIVTMTTAGEAVGVRLDAGDAHVRFRTRVGDRGMLIKVAPLALDDGGVVVANAVRSPGNGDGAPTHFESEVVALDADGSVRTKVTVPLAIVWPLIATRAGVAAIAADGTVFVWAPGYAARSAAGEPVRIGSFGGGLDGGAAALDASTLVAVVDASRIVSLDLQHGSTKVLMTSGSGALLGPPSIAGERTYVLEVTPTGTDVVALDGTGSISPYRLSGLPLGVGADGGVVPISTPVHTATLVDGSGRVAFAGPDGHVGVLSAGNVTTDLGEVICRQGAPPLETPATTAQPSSSTPSLRSFAASRPSAGFAGLAPAGPGFFLVACEGGTLLEIGGGS
jgi:hypothetical protein